MSFSLPTLSSCVLLPLKAWPSFIIEAWLTFETLYHCDSLTVVSWLMTPSYQEYIPPTLDYYSIQIVNPEYFPLTFHHPMYCLFMHILLLLNLCCCCLFVSRRDLTVFLWLRSSGNFLFFFLQNPSLSGVASKPAKLVLNPRLRPLVIVFKVERRRITRVEMMLEMFFSLSIS